MRMRPVPIRLAYSRASPLHVDVVMTLPSALVGLGG
jgi:hypothetical protein